MRWGRLLVVIGLVACARALPPPGGAADREQPRVVSTKPEQQAVVPGFNEEVVFTFDETLSERGVRDAVMVSPETGEATLERDGNQLRVKIAGGWKPNTIYRVVILPTIQDRFNNMRREPAELVFSTGPELIPTAIAGIVTDRITGRAAPNVRVHAVNRRDSTRHTTVTDSAGFFGIRYLPRDNYIIRAFEDANRNNQLDRSEKRAEDTRVIGTLTDTQTVELALLPPDTTPARLIRAEPRDSVEVRLFFDDYLDPDQSMSAITLRVLKMPDSTALPGQPRLLTPRDAERARQAMAAVADTSAARRMRPQPPAVPDTTRALPTQDLVMYVDAGLEPSTRYRVEVTGVWNIRRLPNGGGSVAFTTRARPTPPPRRDTLNLRPR
jgi:hypothetical protein